VLEELHARDSLDVLVAGCRAAAAAAGRGGVRDGRGARLSEV